MKFFNNKSMADIIIENSTKSIYYNSNYLATISNTINDIVYNNMTIKISNSDEKRKYMIINAHIDMSYQSLYVFFHMIDYGSESIEFLENYCKNKCLDDNIQLYISLIADILCLTEYYDINIIDFSKDILDIFYCLFNKTCKINYLPLELVESIKYINIILSENLTCNIFAEAVGDIMCLTDILDYNDSSSFLDYFDNERLLSIGDNRSEYCLDTHEFNTGDTEPKIISDIMLVKSEIIHALFSYIENKIFICTNINNTSCKYSPIIKIGSTQVNCILRTVLKLEDLMEKMNFVILLHVYSENLISFPDFIKQYALLFAPVIIFEYYASICCTIHEYKNKIPYDITQNVHKSECQYINNLQIDYDKIDIIRPNNVDNDLMKIIHYIVLLRIYKNIKLAICEIFGVV